jgi:hypothetical protein
MRGAAVSQACARIELARSFVRIDRGCGGYWEDQATNGTPALRRANRHLGQTGVGEIGIPLLTRAIVPEVAREYDRVVRGCGPNPTTPSKEMARRAKQRCFGRATHPPLPSGERAGVRGRRQ